MKKAITLAITALTAISLFVMAPAALAGKGNGPGDGSGPHYDILDGVPVEVTGMVAVIGTSGDGIGIDTGVEIVTVYGMGPASFWDAAGIAKPEIGEEITVNGYEIPLSDGTFKIVAGSVIIGGDELVLRDPDTGAPLWRGPKGKGKDNEGGHGPGDGTGNGGNGPKDGSSHGNRSGTCTNA